MHLRNIKIGTQLILGNATMLLFVVVIGVVSFLQSDEVRQQTETIFKHPLQVKNALSRLNVCILNARLGERDLLLVKSDQEKHDALQLMELSTAKGMQQFDVLYALYLGPRKDIDDAYNAFISWKVSNQENTRLALSGDIEQATNNIRFAGSVRIHREEMMSKIKIIDDFAQNKAETLFATANESHKTFNIQLILMVTTILLLALIISFILIRNIRKPLNELTSAAKRFRDGDMSTRSSYSSTNEFGMLSDSFNALANDIQINDELDDKVSSLAALMLSEYDAKKFFQATLNALATHTGSQMAAIYLLSADKKTFDHFESTGVDNNARQSFAADSLEGEFGAALSSQKVQHLKNIPKDTRFVFHTVSGKFIPHEIITIPVLADNEVVAVISLATISTYSKQSVQLIDNILVTLCARIEGILAYHNIKEFSKKLEHQNLELDAQKTELASQSSELMEQNTWLEIQKKQLDEANRLKTNFLSNMSHELRTPLNSVIALSGVLNRRLANQIPNEEYSYLEVIERNGKHLLMLINDILDISRIEAGKEEIECTKFSISNLIAEVVSMIHPQAKERNIGLLQLVTDADVFITSDAGKCSHILQNLVGNAVKFTEKGNVVIEARQGINNISIVVTDTGIGISENQLPHIFDEFRQADGSTSRRFGGTGLGLAIAKKYANLLGGTITVTSISGKGSEFTLTLPSNYAAENRIHEAAETTRIKYPIKQNPSKPISDPTVKTILLVEDSEPAIIQIKDFLEESGYRMLIAHNGSEALEIINHTIPDAMILDLMMPGIDGFEVLKTMREAEPTAKIPVLILTAKHITKDELSFLKRNNIHQLIQKGDVNRSDLTKAVATMVLTIPDKTMNRQREVPIIVGKPVVLVIEDNPDNMVTVKALLSDNYTVLEAVDGQEGIAKAKQYKPNLILMDIALPGIDGIEAFKTIRNDPQLRSVLVIALTASAMTSDREAILAHGFDAYLAKPIEEKLFFKTINETLYGK